MVSVRREGWDTFYPDVAPLWQAHHDEVMELGEPPLDPDIAVGEQLFRSGQAIGVCAREGTQMVGYCVYVLGPDLAHKGRKVAEQKMWFVTKSHRKGTIGHRLLAETFRLLKEMGVQDAFPHHRFLGESPAAQRLLEHFGARPVELVYGLKLEG